MTQLKQPADLLFLVGPTAVGKTALALAVAQRLNATILSCDAYCVYRGMDLGTAKPTASERRQVPHRGVDLVTVDTPFSIEAYLSEARAAVDEATAAERPLVVAGGSGFYLKSFFAPVMDAIPVPDAVRAQVAAIEAAEGLPGLQAALRAHGGDSRRGTFDWANPRRVSRALERCLASGRSLAQTQEIFDQQPEPYANHRKWVCLLERPTAELHERIVQRVDAMLAAGLIEEVQQLRADGLEKNPTAEAAIGYRETLAFLRNEIPSPGELREQIILHTRQLARKQRSWFRRQIPLTRTLPAASATPPLAFPEVFPA